MDIEDIRRHKAALAEALAKSITRHVSVFEQQTKMPVKDVYVDIMQFSTDDGNSFSAVSEVRVRLTEI